jgi:hypothetical protein
MTRFNLIGGLGLAVLIIFNVAFTINAGAQTIVVNDVEELYAAVNDSGNAGATIVLNAGTYMLSANDLGGSPRPNGGRIELQENMSLIGSTVDRSASVIDAFNLPSSSYAAQAGGLPVGAVRVGRGRNAIEWLTVRNARFGQGGIVTGLPYGGEPSIRIAHVASTGSTNNLSLLSWGAPASGKTLEVEVEDCDLYSAGFGLKQGFRIGNFSGASGSTVNVRMTGNRIHNNQFSLIVNNAAVNSTINIDSSGNRYFNNGLGLLVTGGLNANGNSVNFRSRGDHFVDNNGAFFTDRGGLLVSGGEDFNQLVPNTSNNNTVNVFLFGCRLYNNQLADLAGYGARTVPNPLIGPPGVNNRVTITMQGTGNRDFVEDYANVVPADATTTNSVTVIR